MGKKGGGGSAPAAPDPVATAQAQGAANKETAYWNALLNQVNQNTPYGSITYTRSGGGSGTEPPQITATTTLSPEQQQILNSQNNLELGLSDLANSQLSRIAGSVNTPYSYDSLGDSFTADDFSRAQSAGQDAIMSRLNPQFARDEEALRTRLINQGIGQGSDAYNREFDLFNQAKNDAMTQAVLQGANYAGNIQNQALQRRQQQIGEYTTTRNAPLNEAIALMSGVQVQNPSFNNLNYGGAAPADISGEINQNYKNQLSQYNARQAAANNRSSALFSLGGTLGAAAMPLMFSDRRLKENARKVREENGFNIYEFNYIGDDKRYEGVMAQEVQEIMPDAVAEINGFLAVDYSKIGVEMREVQNA